MRRHLLIAAALLTAETVALAEDLDPPDPQPQETEPEFNEWVSRYFSLRLGGGMLLDYSSYLQSEDSQEQMQLPSTAGIRDLRVLVSGHLITQRIAYTVGYMYDANNDKWVFRQTGFKFQMPELGGYLFLGRTKEGFSTNKLTVGYYGIFSERSAANDAFIPILADGARWTASVFGSRLIYNLGAFADYRTQKQTFNKNDWQFVGRAVWVPFGRDDTRPLVHLAGEARYAGANDGFLQYRSKPESFLAESYAVDTGKFAASRATTYGVEAYYEPGSWLFGFEYYLTNVSSSVASDPVFHGGDISASYLITGETHPYNYKNGVFDDVVPKHSFVHGGPGAWELGLRLSYVDLEAAVVHGGRFGRVTPVLNWYVTKVLRFEAMYGYGVLDRMDMTSGTQFFQTRMQMSL